MAATMLNDSQKRALALLDTLLQAEDELAELARKIRALGDDEKAKRPLRAQKRAVKARLGAFLPGEAEPDPWRRPDEWALDWCKGWHFAPHTAHAGALGVEIVQRAKVIGHYLEKREPMHRFRLEWIQHSQFAFHDGSTIHSADGQEAICVDNPRGDEEAASKPARKATADAPRNPGRVRFKLFQLCDGKWTGGEDWHDMSQDDFIRYLITGEENGRAG